MHVYVHFRTTCKFKKRKITCYLESILSNILAKSPQDKLLHAQQFAAPSLALLL